MRTACSSALRAPALSNGATFPPITVWHNTEDGRNYLIDGFHRVEAAKKAGINELPFTIKQGEFREAILYSVSLNSTHGLRRSNEDKRKAVMTLLQDEEWSTWSNVAIASQCGVSEFMVRQLRKSICDKNADTNLNNSGESICDKNADTKLNSPDGSTDIKLNNKRKVTRGGKTYVQDTTNIGKGKSSESPLLDEEKDESEENQSVTNNNRTSPDSTNNDSGFLPEYNYPEDNHYYPEDVIKDLWDDENEDDSVNDSVSEDSVNEDSVSYNEDNEDNLELQDNESDKPENPTSTKPNKRRKRQKKKSRLVNPLSVGDKVTVKGNHYFAGEEGEITQISSPNSVIVAFEGNQRQFLQLKDLDLPESLQKPLLEKPQRPRKKEIILKEGLNYFVRESDDKCRWYVELDEEIYQGLKIYQERVQAMSVNAAMMRFLENEGILLRPYPENKIIDEKPSPITSLTNDTRSKLENYISKHGESGIMKLLELES